MRFAVSNRIEADARLAQAEPGAPRPEAFVEPAELEPEQRALYRAATRGYLDAFGERPGARSPTSGGARALPELGVELSSNLGLAAELADGGRELRKVARRRAGAGAPLLDPVDVRVALVRTEEWAPGAARRSSPSTSSSSAARHTPDLDADRAEAHAVDRRTGRARASSSPPTAAPAPGADCQGCAFISGCAKHPG